VTRTGIAAFLVLASAMGAGLGGCGGAPPVASLPPPEVSVSQPIERAVSDALEFTGRIEAVESVDVRARVSGYITRVAFDAGALVKQGDLLFEIDPREYQAAVNHAEGDIARLRANLTRASAEVTRTQRLKSTGAVSEREVDTATGSKSATEGELVAAQAQLEKARLDVQFTRVTAPIAGRASRAEITAGNLVVVGADGGPILTTIVSIDPVLVYFDIDEPSLLRLREAERRRTGRPLTPENIASLQIPVELGLANEPGFPHTGRIDFVDNKVDPATGTMRVRAVLQNDEGLFSPGFFVRVKLAIDKPKPTLLVTERAIGTDQGRKYVLITNDKNVVEYREVQLGPLADGLRAITSGLAPGEWVIVNGIQRARPGITVTPQRVTMEPKAPASAPAGSQAPGGSGAPAGS
jgi:membrane fusion protein, multidrug efflux system